MLLGQVAVVTTSAEMLEALDKAQEDFRNWTRKNSLHASNDYQPSPDPKEGAVFSLPETGFYLHETCRKLLILHTRSTDIT